MLAIGKVNTLKIYRMVDFGAYLTDGEHEVLLPKKYLPAGAKTGERLDVFVYLDSEDRPVATTLRPKGMVGEVVLLEVKELTPIGAFLDWGLEKDLFVPFKEMRDKRMAPGRRYWVKILFDQVSGRIIGTNRFDRIGRKATTEDLKPGDEMEIIVLERLLHGYRVLAGDTFEGMIYFTEIFAPVNIGDRFKAYLVRVRDDGKLDFRLRPGGFDGALARLDEIVRELEKAPGKFLAYDSDTDAMRIQGKFRMSKKQFKQIIGHLYKERRIAFENGGMRLLEN